MDRDLDVRVSRLVGDFGLHDIQTVHDHIDRLVTSGCTKVVVNLGEMTGISSSVLGHLVGVRKELAEKGGDLVLSQPSDFITRVLNIMGLDTVLRVFPDDASAVAFFANGKVVS